MHGRVLISVYDKTGVEDLARFLDKVGYEIVSTGGTYDKLIKAGLPVVKVDTVTGFPEILGGRVKTLHPKIHGGILATKSARHVEELQTHDITPVDIVVCNLYPFIETLSKTGVTEDDLIEQIDIGGVTLLRAAAKNFKNVIVISDPSDYVSLVEALENKTDSVEFRRKLARKAFEHTLQMDTHIVSWLKQTEAQ